MSISRVGVDIAKSVFHVHGVDRHDQVKWRGKYKRDKWLDAIVKRVPTGAVIGLDVFNIGTENRLDGRLVIDRHKG